MARQKKIVTEYRNYSLPIQFPVLLLHGDYWKISDVPSGRLHFHNCLEIGLCHSDSGTMEVLGYPFSFRSGDVTVIPRNVPHTTYSAKGYESHWSYLFFDPQELFRNLIPTSWANSDLTNNSLNNFKYIYSKDEYPTLYFLMESIIRELSMQQPFYKISAKGLLLSLYTELYRLQNIEHDKKQEQLSIDSPVAENALVISPALNYIECNYMHQFSIEQLADLCHWSPTHFRRVFHEIMNTSPLEYINDTRIKKSCTLLRSTEHSVLDISGMVGFHSVSSYNRCFFKTLKMSPSEYRKQMLLSDKKAENSSILEYTGWMFPEKFTHGS